MVRLVLFDIDGTLIRTQGAGVRAFARTFREEFGLEGATEGVRFAGRTDSSLVREILERNGLGYSEDKAQRFFDRYVFWLGHLLEGNGGGVCAGVGGFLQELRGLAGSPRLGLLTGNIRLGAEIKLRRFGLWNEFTMGAFGDDHEDRNQLSRIAQDRGSRLEGRRLRGPEILVVGDTPLDVACGQAIGARTLAVATGGATELELMESRADWVVPDLGAASAREVCGDGGAASRLPAVADAAREARDLAAEHQGFVRPQTSEA